MWRDALVAKGSPAYRERDVGEAGMLPERLADWASSFIGRVRSTSPRTGQERTCLEVAYEMDISEPLLDLIKRMQASNTVIQRRTADVLDPNARVNSL